MNRHKNSLDVKEILPIEFKEIEVIPYDLHCPSVHKIVRDRICSKCYKYFATFVLLKEHIKDVHKKAIQNFKKVRPVRVAAEQLIGLMNC